LAGSSASRMSQSGPACRRRHRQAHPSVMPGVPNWAPPLRTGVPPARAASAAERRRTRPDTSLLAAPGRGPACQPVESKSSPRECRPGCANDFWWCQPAERAADCSPGWSGTRAAGAAQPGESGPGNRARRIGPGESGPGAAPTRGASTRGAGDGTARVSVPSPAPRVGRGLAPRVPRVAPGATVRRPLRGLTPPAARIGACTLPTCQSQGAGISLTGCREELTMRRS
jgi:hypothetical protein